MNSLREESTVMVSMTGELFVWFYLFFVTLKLLLKLLKFYLQNLRMFFPITDVSSEEMEEQSMFSV